MLLPPPAILKELASCLFKESIVSAFFGRIHGEFSLPLLLILDLTPQTFLENGGHPCRHQPCLFLQTTSSAQKERVEKESQEPRSVTDGSVFLSPTAATSVLQTLRGAQAWAAALPQTFMLSRTQGLKAVKSQPDKSS